MHNEHGSVPKSPAADGVIPRLAVLGSIALCVVILYAFLHESGHALVGLLFGGTLTSFSINFWDLSARVSIEGQFGDSQRGLISLAGVTLPLLFWGIYLRLVRPLANAVAFWLTTIGSLGVINTLLAWIILPLVYLSGQVPGDDVISFLQVTRLPPLLVTAVALAVYVAGWALFLARVGGPRDLLSHVRRPPTDAFSPPARAALGALALAAGAAVAVTAAGNVYFAGAATVGPPGYAQVGVIELGAGTQPDLPVHRFTLDRPAQVSLYFLLRDVGSGPAEIALAGPAGYRATFFKSGKDFQAGRATVNPKDLTLAKGDYEIRLTFPPTSGKVFVFVKTEAP